jgi:hypothetical protein
LKLAAGKQRGRAEKPMTVVTYPTEMLR